MHDAKLVKVEGVTLQREITNGFDTLSFKQGGLTMLAKNRFEGVSGAIDSTLIYDMVGILGIENGMKYVYPRRNDDIRRYHTITCTTANHGSFSAPASAGYLSYVTLNINPDNNYHVATLAYYTTDPTVTTAIDPHTYTFVMPDADITIVGTFAVNEYYTVTFDPGTGNCSTTSITETSWYQGVTLPVATPSSNCLNEGYEFVGWAANVVAETMIVPTLYAAGTVYHPSANCTLHAVYAIQQEGWEEVTTLDEVKEGYYVFAGLSHNILFYLPHQGNVSSNPRARAMTVNNGVPSATDHMWKVEKINATEYSISYEDNGTTYYLKAIGDKVQGIGVSSTAPSTGWTFVEDATKGLLATFLHPGSKGDRTTRYIDINFQTNTAGYWYFRSINNVESNLHLFLSPSALYATNPDCPTVVATPQFENLPEGIIYDANYLVTLSCSTPNTSIYYTTDGTEPTNSSSLYGDPFSINDDCTVKAIAYNTAGDYSLVAEHTFDFARRFATIGEFKAAYSEASSEAVIITGDIQFVHRIGMNMYVCDATAGLLVKDFNNKIVTTYDNGDVFQGLMGTYANINGQPMLIPTENTEAGTSGTPVAPVVLTPAEFVGEYNTYDARLVTLTTPVFTEDYNYGMSNNGFGISLGVKVVDLFSTLTIAGVEGDRYDITGFGGMAENLWQLYPRDNTDFNPYFDVLIGVVQHGNIVASAAYAHVGDIITLTPQPEPGYEFEDWMVMDYYGNAITVTDNHFTMPSSAVTVTVSYIQSTYQVNVTASPAGAGTVTGSGTYHYNDVAHVSAVANPHYEFYRWVVSGQAPIYDDADTSFVVTGNMNITAEFNALTPSYEIFLYANPTEGGTVVGGGEYLSDTIVTIQAIPNEGYDFVNWTNSNGVVVSTDPSYTITVTANAAYTANFVIATVTQTTPINVGWNWYSSFIAYDENSLDMMKDTIAANTNSAMIKSQTNFVTLSGGSWDGQLTELDNTQMYMILSNNSFGLSMTGVKVDPSETPITLNPGWTWISYLGEASQSMEAALAALTPAEGDLIKSQTSFSTYTSGSWEGGLEQLEPGLGYIYLNRANASNTLVYPTLVRDFVEVTPVETYWSGDVHRFATNLSVIPTLDANSFAIGEGRYEIGAFVGDDCRGAARLQQVGEQSLAFLSVSGNAGEEILFKLYDVTTGEVYANVANERIQYVPDAIHGSVSEPLVLHFGCNGVNDWEAQVSLYPNPVKDELRITGTAIEEVKVYDLLGQLVITKNQVGEDQVTLDFGALSAGVYTLTIRTDHGVTTRRIVKE